MLSWNEREGRQPLRPDLLSIPLASTPNQQKQAKRLVYQLKGVQQTHPQDWLVRHLKGVHEVDK